jgi:predicted kinase
MIKEVTFLMLRGLPASGKSTFANKLILDGLCGGGWKRINKDMMRDMIDGGKFSPDNEDSLNTLVYDMALHYLMLGFSVVSDNMNFNIWHFRRARLVCNDVNDERSGLDFHCKLDVKDFYTPIETCIERDALRPKPVTEGVILAIADKWVVDGKFPEVWDFVDNHSVEGES